MKTIEKIDEFLVERVEKEWGKDPYQYKRNLELLLKEYARWIMNIPVSDRYFRGVDHSPKEKAYIDRVYKMIGTAVKNLDSAINKAKKIKY